MAADVERSVDFVVLGQPLAIELANTVFVRRGETVDVLGDVEELNRWLRVVRRSFATPPAPVEPLAVRPRAPSASGGARAVAGRGR
jgi:Putative stress-induced transcription regulator